MIPENKTEAVKNALQSVFGTSKTNDIERITTGLSSAMVLRIVVKGTPYLLRIITRTDAMADPTGNYASMQKAAAAGIAPKVWYMSVADRFSITDFIEAKPFSLAAAREKLPGIIKKLHSLADFPTTQIIIAFNLADSGIQRVKALNLMPEAETREIFARYEAISRVYPKDKDILVSCYNDLKPENIVYDGEKPWLIDWESAFLNYRYADLAIVTNFINDNLSQETEFLKNYLGTEPGEYELACFYLMQQVVHINYFTMLLAIVQSTGKAFDYISKPLSVKELQGLIIKWGELINRRE